MIIACDPGADGAFAFLSMRRDFYATLNTAVTNYWDIIGAIQGPYATPIRACKEYIGLHKGDQIKFKSMRVLLQHDGRAKLAFELARVEYVEYQPKAWQYPYGLVGLSYDDRKDRAVTIAEMKFPDIRITKSNADALLLADYHWHVVTGTAIEKPNNKLIRALTITRIVDKINY